MPAIILEKINYGTFMNTSAERDLPFLGGGIEQIALTFSATCACRTILLLTLNKRFADMCLRLVLWYHF